MTRRQTYQPTPWWRRLGGARLTARLLQALRRAA